jgi:hypothetical protein
MPSNSRTPETQRISPKKAKPSTRSSIPSKLVFDILQQHLPGPFSTLTKYTHIPLGDVKSFVDRSPAARRAEAASAADGDSREDDGRGRGGGGGDSWMPKSPVSAFDLYCMAYYAQARAFCREVLPTDAHMKGRRSVLLALDLSWRIEMEPVRDGFLAWAEMEWQRQVEALLGWPDPSVGGLLGERTAVAGGEGVGKEGGCGDVLDKGSILEIVRPGEDRTGVWTGGQRAQVDAQVAPAFPTWTWSDVSLEPQLMIPPWSTAEPMWMGLSQPAGLVAASDTGVANSDSPLLTVPSAAPVMPSQPVVTDPGVDIGLMNSWLLTLPPDRPVVPKPSQPPAPPLAADTGVTNWNQHLLRPFVPSALPPAADIGPVMPRVAGDEPRAANAGSVKAGLAEPGSLLSQIVFAYM